VEDCLLQGPPTIDIGANLVDKSFAKDREAVLERATRAGVAAMIVTGTCERTARAAAELCASEAGQRHGLWFTAGVHPHHAKVLLRGWWQRQSGSRFLGRHANCMLRMPPSHTCPPPQDFTDGTLATLRDLARHPRCVAIGEAGLDFNRNFSPPAAQERCLAAQLELAEELGLPLFLHCRDAGERMAALLRTHRRSSPGVVHCFTGSAAELDEFLAQGLHIGITGWVCDERPERGGAQLAALLPRIPGELLPQQQSYLLAARSPQPSFKDAPSTPAPLMQPTD
jgi:TatD DNase family protein